MNAQGHKHANTTCGGTVLHTHAQLLRLDFSNKNNYYSLQHKGLFSCLNSG